MSDMKCPFCQQELEIDPCGEMGCPNDKCKESVFLIGTKDFWETFIRTHKALKLAVDGLEKMTWGCDSSDAEHLLKEIKEITALTKGGDNV